MEHHSSEPRPVALLNQIIGTATAHLDFRGALEATLKRACAVLDVDTGAVLLHESRSRHLVAVAAIGLRDRLFPEIRVPGGSGFAGHVAERREPVVIDRVDGMRFVPRYSENSITRDGPEMQRIAAAAGEHGIHVVVGFSERENGTLYMSQAFIDDTGRIISVRRKL